MEVGSQKVRLCMFGSALGIRKCVFTASDGAWELESVALHIRMELVFTFEWSLGVRKCGFTQADGAGKLENVALHRQMELGSWELLFYTVGWSLGAGR